MPSKFTHEKFLELLWERNDHYRNEEFEVVGNYEHSYTPIKVKDKYGYCLVTPIHLMRNKGTSIRSAINKTDYFKREVLERNTFYRRGDFEIVGEYKKRIHKITVKDDVSTYSVTANCLLSDFSPTIQNIESVEGKTEYCLNKIKQNRKDFEKTDYSKMRYIAHRENLTFICKIHNYEYKQRLGHHINNHQGCVHCMENPIMYNDDNIKRHNEFLSGIRGYLYVLKFKSKTEEFYKVGITAKNRLSTRVKQLSQDYKVEVVYKELNDMVSNFKLEQRFLEEFETFKYEPKLKFRGFTECLTVNPVEYYYHYKNILN